MNKFLTLGLPVLVFVGFYAYFKHSDSFSALSLIIISGGVLSMIYTLIQDSDKRTKNNFFF